MQQVSPAAQPPFQSYPPDHHQQPHPVPTQQPPHVLSNNPHYRNNLHGTPNPATNTPHPAFGMLILKERQLQQRVLQQQQQNATSITQKSQLPVSSPQNGTQIPSQPSFPVSYSPTGTPPVAQNSQKHPDPQTGSTQIPKQQRPSSQFHPSNKFTKGGTIHRNPNGLSGDQSVEEKNEQVAPRLLLESGQRNSNPAILSQSKPSVSSDNSNRQNHPPSLVASSSTMPVVTAANHQHPPPQPHPKLVSLSRATTARRTANNGSVNSLEPPTCKLQASSAGRTGERLGMDVDQSMVHGQRSPDRLPNPVGHDVGVQWQQLPSS